MPHEAVVPWLVRVSGLFLLMLGIAKNKSVEIRIGAQPFSLWSSVEPWAELPCQVCDRQINGCAKLMLTMASLRTEAACFPFAVLRYLRSKDALLALVGTVGRSYANLVVVFIGRSTKEFLQCERGLLSELATPPSYHHSRIDRHKIFWCPRSTESIGCAFVYQHQQVLSGARRNRLGLAFSRGHRWWGCPQSAAHTRNNPEKRDAHQDTNERCAHSI